MKTSSIFLLAGALTLAAGTALVARALMRPPPPVTIVKEVAAPRPPDVMVLSAAHPLQPGDFVGSGQLAWRKLDGQPAADQITATSDAERLKHERSLLGAALRRPMETDTPITQNALVHPGQPGFIAAVLAPGMRAVSVPTSAVSSNAGLVSAGDYVDVILSLERGPDPNDEQDKSPFKPLAAQTILHNVRVLALNNNTASIVPAAAAAAAAAEADASGADKPAARSNARAFYETITLEVPPGAAEKLAVAKEVGPLQVSLRGAHDQYDKDGERTLASNERTAGSSSVTRLKNTTAIFERNPKAAPTVVHVYRGQTNSKVAFD